jgi:hypothetical protein
MDVTFVHNTFSENTAGLKNMKQLIAVQDESTICTNQGMLQQLFGQLQV